MNQATCDTDGLLPAGMTTAGSRSAAYFEAQRSIAVTIRNMYEVGQRVPPHQSAMSLPDAQAWDSSHREASLTRKLPDLSPLVIPFSPCWNPVSQPPLHPLKRWDSQRRPAMRNLNMERTCKCPGIKTRHIMLRVQGGNDLRMHACRGDPDHSAAGV